MDEHRRSARLRSFKGGAILFEPAPSVDCIIRNMSQTGACLEIPTYVTLPDQFILLIKHQTLQRRCRVAWRDSTQIGVRFK